MYGRLHERKLKQDDFIMSCQKARKQLDFYIDQQAKRVNIDSAKKRAVLQHMDYQGFRQMVLGANIFPTKSAELYQFSKGQGQQSIIPNKIFLQGGNAQQSQRLVQAKNMIGQQLLRKVQGKSQLQCNSFREFKKKFTQNYPKNGQLTNEQGQALYNLIKYQDLVRVGKIFNMDCEASILVKIVDVFEFILNYLRQNDSQGRAIKEIAYQIKFLQIVLKLKNMRQFSLSILSKKQRSRIVQYLQKGRQFINSVNNIVVNNNENDISSNNQVNEDNIMLQQIKKETNIQVSKQVPNDNDQIIIQKTGDDKIIEQLIRIVSKK